MRPSAVRSQARNVRSLANESCTSGSWPSAARRGRPSPPIMARPPRRRRAVSVTPVTEIVDRGERRDRRPGAVATLVDGIERGLHLGAQLYVSVDGKAVADIGIGEARAGTPMTPDSMVIWFSMTKPSVAVAVAQQWERGALELDDPVVRAPPRVRGPRQGQHHLRHLLTHTAGIRGGDAVTSTAPGDAYWDEIVAGISAIEREADWVPGQRGRLPPQLRDDDAGRDRAPASTAAASRQYVRDEVFPPLGMDDCWVGMPADAVAGYGDRIGTMHSTAPAWPSRSTIFDAPDFLWRCIPGGGGRGPMRQLGAPLRGAAGAGAARRRACALAADGRGDRPRATASASTTRRSTRSATGASGSRSTPSRWVATRRPPRSGTAARCRRSRSRIPSTGSSWSCRPTACAGTTTTTSVSMRVTTALYEDLGLAAAGRTRSRQAVPFGRAHRSDRLTPGDETYHGRQLETKKVDDVQPGDVVRYAGQEFTVARVDTRSSVATRWCASSRTPPTRWHTYPAAVGGDVEVRTRWCGMTDGRCHTCASSTCRAQPGAVLHRGARRSRRRRAARRTTRQPATRPDDPRRDRRRTTAASAR